GVVTPLTWTFFNEPFERAQRGAYADLGVLPGRDVRVPDSIDDRFVAIFFGRFAGNITMVRAVSDLIPGTSGDAVEEQAFGEIRSGQVSRHSRRRYPAILTRAPVTVARIGKRIRARRAEVDQWWGRAVGTPVSPARAGPRVAESL